MIVDKPKKFEVWFGNYWHKKFKSINLIPDITLIKDSQLDETWETEETLHIGYTTYSILLEWLGLYIEFSLNICNKINVDNN